MSRYYELRIPKWRTLVCRIRGHAPHDIAGCCTRCGKLIAMIYGGIA